MRCSCFLSLVTRGSHDLIIVISDIVVLNALIALNALLMLS